ncbi:3-methyl-2-oxobutanoate hydroxymethyltransferase [Thermoflexus sp.]|uniref:3-methyl-2-oxobutanoate hydroxymethyltransferase n=1 Tax=Thermoflexus sp. TaxID=1969742 RepID=UPI0025E330B8|nr:3-methyl-2-oxobutanoate hydroxymethyltransferase [Thermoflexus sp.]MCS7350503.1 3-methyl-2-oxobutanoate hydroxymethyltransferase [Thermoflexus sp.]MCX7690324.1 3-methyl-2-oxobutanoate hydroxymethyltransferase [Thermoflexus sp.]MDW8179954.1 3-methyl-2-oxobutanoate hydroxymethyltransferase [Anaerolineae bacterium]
MARKKVTIHTLQARKAAREPITMITAYDYPTALAVDQAGVDVILVGDSLGMVVLGYSNTLPVTMEEMLHHAKAVARANPSALLVGDLPFMAYQADLAEAVRNAGRFLKEAGMDAVKLEGGQEMVSTIEAIVRAGIPVMGHIGLTPQSLHKLGGYRLQGRTAVDARRLLEDALALEAAGCFAIVLEMIPEPVATAITQRLRIPTIGIGAGSGCDGQVLVLHDLLGLFDRFTPRFVKKYADLHREIVRAVQAYCEDVRSHRFPGPEHAFSMDPEELAAFQVMLEAFPAPTPVEESK